MEAFYRRRRKSERFKLGRVGRSCYFGRTSQAKNEVYEMGRVQFSCPKCGSQIFETTSQPKSLEEFYGAVCAKCGTVIGKNDIQGQARDVADKLVRDAIRKAGFK
jgi:predicted RNA-binding Zn-ribbon protein involved in translation (DUF1610 family)